MELSFHLGWDFLWSRVMNPFPMQVHHYGMEPMQVYVPAKKNVMIIRCHFDI